MEMRHTKVFWLVLKLFIFSILFCNCKRTVEGKDIEFQKGEEIDFKSRMLKIEERSRLQDNEMEILKIKAEEDRKVINQLEERVLKLENPVGESEAQAEREFRREKRIFRLLSPHQPNVVKTKQNETEGELSNQPFYGPPTNCYDLGKLGYTLNGYYLVKGNYFSKTGKVVVVYCKFKQPIPTQYAETLPVGEVQMKTKSVHFFVQRKNYFSGHNKTIPFEVERLNVGGAMKLATGIFTAPVGGIYHFQFSGRKDSSPGYLEVVLEINSERISYSCAGKWGSNMNHNFTVLNGINIFLHLKTGDRVNLVKYGPDAALCDASGYPITHFTGSLLEEDIVLL